MQVLSWKSNRRKYNMVILLLFTVIMYSKSHIRRKSPSHNSSYRKSKRSPDGAHLKWICLSSTLLLKEWLHGIRTVKLPLPSLQNWYAVASVTWGSSLALTATERPIVHEDIQFPFKEITTFCRKSIMYCSTCLPLLKSHHQSGKKNYNAIYHRIQTKVHQVQ